MVPAHEVHDANPSTHQVRENFRVASQLRVHQFEARRTPGVIESIEISEDRERTQMSELRSRLDISRPRKVGIPPSFPRARSRKKQFPLSGHVIQAVEHAHDPSRAVTLRCQDHEAGPGGVHVARVANKPPSGVDIQGRASITFSEPAEHVVARLTNMSVECGRAIRRIMGGL